MPPALPAGTRFEVPTTGQHKYVARVPTRDGVRTVRFGHAGYEQYRDAVPKAMGGGRWAHKDHGDAARRANFRQRAGAQRCKGGSPCISRRYSPAWFSYHFLW